MGIVLTRTVIQENGKKVSSQETLLIHASCNEKPFISTVAWETAADFLDY